MSLAAGVRVGSYQILGLLGSGGMGEVYRARDLRLDRVVALKMLPAEVAADPERFARFEHEAHAAAQLSHPNIVSIFEFGNSGTQAYVAMELLEGETLRDRLLAGPLPLRKAIEVATQIARGLGAAHDRNLVHRDLKPENIFLLRDGQVKILDFGLAKSVTDPGSLPAQDTEAKTALARTTPGVIMGTVGYMAPEQVRGGVVDARTDLFALGAVLYEMLTGARAFQRDSDAETLTAILRDDPPDLSRIRQDLPPALDRIVEHALEKSAAERFQTARDFIFALAALHGSTGATTDAPASSSAIHDRNVNRTTLVAVAATCAVVAGVIGWWLGQRSPAGDDLRWQTLTQLTDESGEETMPRISPDGTSFAYVSHARGSWDIYVQRVGGRQPVAVTATDTRDEEWPAFSPDGTQIAFNEADADGGIFVIGATGESARRLTDAGFNPAWSPDGRKIVFAAEGVANPYVRGISSALWIVDASGGTPRQLYAGDAVQPAWSPSGARIAFWSNTGGQRDLATIAADGTKPVALLNDAAVDWAPAWSPDGSHLYFASDRGGTMGLWRIAVNQETGRVLESPQPVAAGVEASMELPSLSADGRTLLFRSRITSINPVGIRFDPLTERAGEPKPLLTRTGILKPSDVSPDGQWLLLTNEGERREDLFVIRTDGTGLRRLTDDDARDRRARWTPDGTSVVFFSNRDGRFAPWSIRADGSALSRLTEAADVDLMFPAVSPADGSLVVSAWSDTAFLVPPKFPAPRSVFRELKNLAVDGGVLSPALWSRDGRYLSGGVRSRESGSIVGIGVYDVNAGKAWKVSGDAGVASVPFLPDGKRLIYVAGNRLVVVEIDTLKRRVLPVLLSFPMSSDAFAASPDGRMLYYGAHRVESNVWKAQR